MAEPVQSSDEPRDPERTSGPDGRGNGAERNESPPEPPPPHATTRPWVRPVLIGIGALVVLAGLVVGGRYYVYASSHTSTDDAYVTSDVVRIAPQVSGTVAQVPVTEYQHVRKGDLLVALDDATYRASVEQAQANLDAAIAQAQGAGATVAVTSGSSQAQELEARAGVAQADTEIAAARADVARAEAAVETARAGVRAAEQGVRAAQAVAHRLQRDARRYRQLAAQGAVSQQTVDQAVAAEEEATAQYHAARDQVSVATAGVRQAEAQLTAAQQSVRAASARRQQALARLTRARTAPQEVAASKSAQSGARAKIEQARAALRAAKLQLGYTRIYAPVDGQVTQKTAEVGQLVQPGMPVIAIVPSGDLWVQANFKETQMSGVRPGETATVRADALPGLLFRGRVAGIAAATGATFALLPPENATGNFTKVVQRVPVKITLDPGQRGLDRLAAGLSVLVTVETR